MSESDENNLGNKLDKAIVVGTFTGIATLAGGPLAGKVTAVVFNALLDR